MVNPQVSTPPPHCIVTSASPRDWPTLLDLFPRHTVFHTLPWLKAIEAVHGASFHLAKAENNGECVAVWPIFSTRKGPLRILGSPVPGWTTAYMGPLFASKRHVRSTLDAFFNHELFQSGSYFSCKVLVDELDMDLSRYGFTEVEKLDTYCIDLTQSTDKLWNNLKSECRTRIRKAEKLGLEVKHETDDSFIDEYWQMTQETFANCKIKPPFSREFAAELWQRLYPRDAVRAVSAIHRGERIATLVLPFDMNAMYYWGGASYLRCRGIPAHNLLHWRAIEMGVELGLRQYDFVSTAGGGGRFKKTFGPQTVHMATHWERTSSRLIQALKSGYQSYLTWQQKLSA